MSVAEPNREYGHITEAVGERNKKREAERGQLDCLVALQAVLPFIAPEVVNRTTAMRCGLMLSGLYSYLYTSTIYT